MEKLKFKLNGVTYERITKKKAAELYNNDCKVYLLSSKLNPYSPWVSLTEVTISSCYHKSFSNVVNNFKYYNCDAIRGNVVRFFKIEKTGE
jgi:hypothetical protein